MTGNTEGNALNEQNLEEQQGHQRTQISAKSHNDAFAAPCADVVDFLFASLLGKF